MKLSPEPRFSLPPLWVMLLILLQGCGGDDSSEQPVDPIVTDYPIAYIQRPMPEPDPDTGGRTFDITQRVTFEPGARLLLKSRATPSASVRDISSAAFPPGSLYDVKDLSVSYDGDTLLFAMRGPFIPGADDEDQPSWNIWRYSFSTGALQRVIDADNIAEAGQDLSPALLPDGRIVFASTRQQTAKAILLDEGKPQFEAQTEDMDEPTLNIHIMDADGTNIQQLTFNQSHEFDPAVLPNGQIVFSRWENALSRSAIHLYRMNPDGTGLELLYGANSHDYQGIPNLLHFTRPQPAPNGHLLAIYQPMQATHFGGQLTFINYQQYSDADQSLYGLPAIAGQANATASQINFTGTSLSGRYLSGFPLWDGTNRLLVSWSPCRLQAAGRILPCTAENLANPAASEADPLFGIWVYDPATLTQRPVVTAIEGSVFSEVVAGQRRGEALILGDENLDATLAAENAGLLDIRSVYDFDGVFFNLGADASIASLNQMADPSQTSATERPARFLRLFKPVSIPDRDVLNFDRSAFGVTQAFGMREILGYVPIEPDGSVRVKVPANIAFSFQILDDRGRNLSLNHQTWLQLKPGETLQCNGCHSPLTSQPHGRRGATPPSINTGADGAGNFTGTAGTYTGAPGDTMAQAHAIADPASSTPGVDLVFDDLWAATPTASFAYRYDDLDTSLAKPVSDTCIASWSATCRIRIHYEQHIQPIWELPRPVVDPMTMAVIDDHTCTLCHNRKDAMNVTQVPAAQLELTSQPHVDQPDHFTSYRELLRRSDQLMINPDNPDQLIVETQPVLDNQGNPVYQTDNEGNLVLDAMGNPIPVTEPVTVAPPMSLAGANASNTFFNLFEGGSHTGYLTDAELRLISEWLDMGAQYYNDPFLAPLN